MDPLVRSADHEYVDRLRQPLEPNVAGRTTLVRRIIGPITHLPFVNADELAARAASV